jgi:hypothetical protein
MVARSGFELEQYRIFFVCWARSFVSRGRYRFCETVIYFAGGSRRLLPRDSAMPNGIEPDSSAIFCSVWQVSHVFFKIFVFCETEVIAHTLTSRKPRTHMPTIEHLLETKFKN